MKRLTPILALLALGCSAAEKPKPPAPEVGLRQFLAVPIDCRCQCLLPVKPKKKPAGSGEGSITWELLEPEDEGGES